MGNDNIIDVKEGDSNLILTMPHSAQTVPEGFKHNLDLNDPKVIEMFVTGVDICVPYVTNFHNIENATKIHSTLPRVILDVNRLNFEFDKYSVTGGPDLMNPHGLIWRASSENSVEEIVDTLKKPYTKKEFENMMEKVYYPYVQAIQDQSRRVHEKHGISILWDLHSMPGTFAKVVQEEGKYQNAYIDTKKLERGLLADGKLPDIMYLNSPKPTASSKLVDSIMNIFRDHGLIVEKHNLRNVKHGSLREKYSDPDNNYHIISTEISGHYFEPERRNSKLVYDNTKEKQFQNAFKDAFTELQKLK